MHRFHWHSHSLSLFSLYVSADVYVALKNKYPSDANENQLWVFSSTLNEKSQRRRALSITLKKRAERNICSNLHI